MNIIWKQIPVYPAYEASSAGQIRNAKTSRELKQRKDHKGYARVKIGNSWRTTHRLVAIAFLPLDQDRPQVNHINGIKHDNRLENLEWVNQSENMNHAIRIGIKKYRKGQCHAGYKVTPSVVKEIRNLRLQKRTIREIMTIVGIGKTAIHKVLNGNHFSAKIAEVLQ